MWDLDSINKRNQQAGENALNAKTDRDRGLKPRPERVEAELLGPDLAGSITPEEYAASTNAEKAEWDAGQPEEKCLFSFAFKVPFANTLEVASLINETAEYLAGCLKAYLEVTEGEVDIVAAISKDGEVTLAISGAALVKRNDLQIAEMLIAVVAFTRFNERRVTYIIDGRPVDKVF